MEEVTSIEQWINSYTAQPVEYAAVFDPVSGTIHAVGSTTALKNYEHKISIDQETAELILEGRICLNNCSVDITGTTFKLSETRSVYKIDDVLHRIINIDHFDINEKYNIYLTYKDRCLTIELTEEYGGTKPLPDKFQPVSTKSIKWSGNTDMSFIVTEYNDPNIILKLFTIKVDELINNKFVIDDIDLPKKFSVYTRRLFKNYVIEIK